MMATAGPRPRIRDKPDRHLTLGAGSLFGMADPRFIYYAAASLDGFLADEHGGLDWLFRFDGADGVTAHYERFIAGIGALIMGRATWDFVARSGHPWAYGDTPTWVLTHRPLDPIPGANAHVSTNAREAALAARVAAGERDVWVVGGGNVAAQLLENGHLDELHLGVVPLFLGRGLPLLPVRTGELELIGQATFGRGLVELRYRFPR